MLPVKIAVNSGMLLFTHHVEKKNTNGHSNRHVLTLLLWSARIAGIIRALACRPCARLAKEGTAYI